MTEPRLTVRSAKARELAYRLARLESRSMTEIVERALEAYEANCESAASFYARLAAPSDGDDIDLEAIIKEDRRRPRDVEF